MEHKGDGIGLLAHGGVADARGREDDIVFPEEKIFVAAAVFLGAVEQDAQLIVIFMPVVAVVEHIVDKAADGEIFPGPVQLIICKFHPSSSQNPNIFLSLIHI